MRAGCLLILGLLLVAVGCGGGGSSTSDSTGSNAVLVSYNRTGGVAGTYETLIVHENGGAEITEGFGGAETARFSLPPDELAALQQQLASTHLDRIGSAPQSACADCYLYVITYRGTTVRRDEVRLPAKAKPLVTRLQAIVDAHR